MKESFPQLLLHMAPMHRGTRVGDNNDQFETPLIEREHCTSFLGAESADAAISQADAGFTSCSHLREGLLTSAAGDQSLLTKVSFLRFTRPVWVSLAMTPFRKEGEILLEDYEKLAYLMGLADGDPFRIRGEELLVERDAMRVAAKAKLGGGRL